MQKKPLRPQPKRSSNRLRHHKNSTVVDSRIILLNKPFNALCQFSDEHGRQTLKDFIPNKPGFYPAGRLDYDSEGLVILTNDGRLQHKISSPKFAVEKTYYAQVDGQITADAIEQLQQGVQLKDGLTRPAKARIIEQPDWLWERNPPVRYRANIPTSWLELVISEGKNRQVRRMTAAVGFPTLRLIRVQVGEWHLESLKPGDYKELQA